jgi:hypothetical protein
MLDVEENPYIVEDIRIGILTFRAVIKDGRGVKQGVLLQCDCGRYITIPIGIFWRQQESGRVVDIPWSCEECEYTKPSANAYRPWHDPPRYPPRKLAADTRRMSVCDKELHKKEWFAWQQAKRISKGVVKRWLDFKLFFKDMGPAPRGARLSKRKPRQPHGPQNSFWMVGVDFHWHGTVVSALWITKTHGVPKQYLIECRRAKFLEAEAIVTRYRSGKPSPKLGESDPVDLCPQHVG